MMWHFEEIPTQDLRTRFTDHQEVEIQFAQRAALTHLALRALIGTKPMHIFEEFHASYVSLHRAWV